MTVYHLTMEWLSSCKRALRGRLYLATSVMCSYWWFWWGSEEILKDELALQEDMNCTFTSDSFWYGLLIVMTLMQKCKSAALMVSEWEVNSLRKSQLPIVDCLPTIKTTWHSDRQFLQVPTRNIGWQTGCRLTTQKKCASPILTC